MISVGPQLVVEALPGLPELCAGDTVSDCIIQALVEHGWKLEDDDVLVVTSKLFSKAEGRRRRLSEVEPGSEALALATRVGKDPRLVELILAESVAVSRARPGVLITRHRLGIVSANAGIDASNTGAGDDTVLLLPEDPDASARALRRALRAYCSARIAVLVTDSLGRPFRSGTVGAAIGLAGLSALNDQRGRPDRGGRLLQYTLTALADQLAAAADLVSGQADEARPVTRIRGIRGVTEEDGPGACALLRAPDEDLYA